MKSRRCLLDCSTSGRQARRDSTTSVRAPSRSSATGSNAKAPMASRAQISVVGSSSRTPTLMNMNDDPQEAASASSMRE